MRASQVARILGLTLVLTGCADKVSTSFDSSQISLNARTSPSTQVDVTSRNAMLRRREELGKRQYLTQEELREFVILDSRLGVMSGNMTKEDFESWTGEKF